MVPGLVLFEFPPGGLLQVMMMTTAGPGVTRTRPAAFFPGDGMLEVATLGGPPAQWIVHSPSRISTRCSAAAGVVRGGLVPVVAFGDGNGFQVGGQVEAATW